MRLTMRTNLAMRALMHCAVQAPEMLRTADVARACNASFHHLAAVVHGLEAAGFLNTARGRKGGIALARPAAEISVGQVFRIFEAEVPFAECLDPAHNTCPLIAVCRLQGVLCRALDAFYAELDRVTLQDLVDGNTGLARLFAA
ncbi:MAG: Rrf2 family transcriptional regulator [Limimaricola sp.]|uniref:RrF2 family transcriptional regulator n=1 Tax=Limimaricola sp. TaxID=2211665 RepID=UPI001DEBE237|nr:Rrf2 family transcriptional regulator [Limimaricola sp.]MBI1417526.1 Rrf2 family transcriptional regulator [Limimaricola sp.]